MSKISINIQKMLVFSIVVGLVNMLFGCIGVIAFGSLFFIAQFLLGSILLVLGFLVAISHGKKVRLRKILRYSLAIIAVWSIFSSLFLMLAKEPISYVIYESWEEKYAVGSWIYIGPVTVAEGILSYSMFDSFIFSLLIFGIIALPTSLVFTKKQMSGFNQPDKSDAPTATVSSETLANQLLNTSKLKRCKKGHANSPSAKVCWKCNEKLE